MRAMAHALLGLAPSLGVHRRSSCRGRPVSELDTKGHMALIRRSIVFTPNGSELISASDDKTIRVWDVAAMGAWSPRSPTIVVNDGKIIATIKRGENAGYAHNAYNHA